MLYFPRELTVTCSGMKIYYLAAMIFVGPILVNLCPMFVESQNQRYCRQSIDYTKFITPTFSLALGTNTSLRGLCQFIEVNNNKNFIPQTKTIPTPSLIFYYKLCTVTMWLISL